MILLWIYFIVFIVATLALDLLVLHRRAHVIAMKEALTLSAVWIAMGLSFAIFVYFGYDRHWFGLGLQMDPLDGSPLDGTNAAVKYITGYVIEKSLSVDNLFVIATIFQSFSVPKEYRHRVLFWGILGALIMRGLMIACGSELIARFHWVLYVFGAFLMATGVQMFVSRNKHTDPSKSWMAVLMRRFLPLTDVYQGQRFVVRSSTEDVACGRVRRVGQAMLTPLALALIMVEGADLIFAVDSVPAVFAITADPFLVYTSNVFAILGLRSLYFALEGMIDKFRYLKPALAMVLFIVGVKMLVAGQLKEMFGGVVNVFMLGLIILIVMGGIVASIVVDRRTGKGSSPVS